MLMPCRAPPPSNLPLQMPLGSNVLHHLLPSYQAALSAVCLSQLDASKVRGVGYDDTLVLPRVRPLAQTHPVP